MVLRHHLAASFLVLSIVIVTISAPIILEENGTSLVWVTGGAALLWIGIRKQSIMLRAAGMFLQGGGAYLFLDAVFYPLYSTVFFNSYFFSCLFIGSCGLHSSYFLERGGLGKIGALSALLLIIWGLLWWYIAGLREVASRLLEIESHNSFLLYSCAISIVMTIAARKLRWPKLGAAQLAFLPVAFGCGVAGWHSLSGSSHLLAGKGWIAWAVATFCQIRMLRHYRGVWPEKIADIYYSLSFLLLAVLFSHELSWIAVAVIGWPPVSGTISWLLLPSLVLAAIFQRSKMARSSGVRGCTPAKSKGLSSGTS